ncbi:MAG: HAD-IC family P-type ATPase [Treponema sp.]|nr:HAD-IC family P-type ATPase [Treponema sp.]
MPLTENILKKRTGIVLLIFLAAVISAAVWFIISSVFEFSLTIYIYIIIIICPCISVLAIPAILKTAIGILTKNGILLKNKQLFESIEKIQIIAFEKTGIITEGKPEIIDLIIGNSEWGIGNWKESKEINDNFLQLAASAEKRSEDPLGLAIVNEAEKRKLSLHEIKDLNIFSGLGIETNVIIPNSNSINGVPVLIGNKRLMLKKNIILGKFDNISDRLSNEGKNPVFVALHGKIAGIIVLNDIIKTNTNSAIEKIYKIGIDIILITEENRETSEAIAKKSGIKRVISEVLPQDKNVIIKNLQTGNKKVTMIGFSKNDVYALNQADIAIAFSSSSDSVKKAADITLTSNDLMDFFILFNLSKNANRLVKQNLFWVFIYNALVIPLSGGLLYIFGGLFINPVFTAGVIFLSSMSILLNFLKLKLLKK